MADLTITEEPDGSLTLTDGQHVETLDAFMATATPRELLPAWFAQRRAEAAEEQPVHERLAAGARAMADSRDAGLSEEQVWAIVAEYEDAGQQLAAALGTPDASLRELVGMAVDAVARAREWAEYHGVELRLDPMSRVGSSGGRDAAERVEDVAPAL